MKIGVAGIVQESNTFAPAPSTLKDFAIETRPRQSFLRAGEQIRRWEASWRN